MAKDNQDEQSAGTSIRDLDDLKQELLQLARLIQNGDISEQTAGHLMDLACSMSADFSEGKEPGLHAIASTMPQVSDRILELAYVRMDGKTEKKVEEQQDVLFTAIANFIIDCLENKNSPYAAMMSALSQLENYANPASS